MTGKYSTHIWVSFPNVTETSYQSVDFSKGTTAPSILTILAMTWESRPNGGSLAIRIATSKSLKSLKMYWCFKSGTWYVSYPFPINGRSCIHVGEVQDMSASGSPYFRFGGWFSLSIIVYSEVLLLCSNTACTRLHPLNEPGQRPF